MLLCQKSLINHLNLAFSAPEVRTVKAYAGELARAAENSVQLTELLPAVLVMFIDGRPAAEKNGERYHQFDLLIITQNDTSTMLESHQDNLQLVSEVSDFLSDKSVFASNTGLGTYRIRRNDTIARTILNDARF